MNCHIRPKSATGQTSQAFELKKLKSIPKIIPDPTKSKGLPQFGVSWIGNENCRYHSVAKFDLPSDIIT